jgi:hypothetical protein
MKVIATLNDDKVLCEISMSEIAQLKGMNSIYDNAWSKDMAKIGSEIDISAGVSALAAIRTLDRSKLDSLQRDLKTALRLIEQTRETADALTFFDKLAGEIK